MALGRGPAATRAKRDHGRRLTQTLDHRVQCRQSGSINPRVLGVEVVCNGDDDGEQHGVQALSEEGNHLGEGLQRPLVHFLVGILKPWGESIEHLLREQKPRARGNQAGRSPTAQPPTPAGGPCGPDRRHPTWARTLSVAKSVPPQRGGACWRAERPHIEHSCAQLESILSGALTLSSLE